MRNYLRANGVPDCDDALGDVFVRVAKGIDRFEGDDEQLRRWVFTIAHHRLVDGHRRRAKERPVETRATVAESHDPFDPDLAAALRALTPEQREVVVLRFVADLSLETVAELTGRTVGAVKAMQHRALAQLATMLQG